MTGDALYKFQFPPVGRGVERPADDIPCKRAIGFCYLFAERLQHELAQPRLLGGIEADEHPRDHFQ
jgi:hypothetical protein